MLPSILLLPHAANGEESMFSPPMETTTFVGRTIADDRLKTDIIFSLAPVALIATKCQKYIDRVESEIIAIPKHPTFNQSKIAISGEVIERWNLTLCEKQLPAIVKYTFTPEGKTNYSISLEPGR
jgi:hypothetical protein